MQKSKLLSYYYTSLKSTKGLEPYVLKSDRMGARARFRLRVGSNYLRVNTGRFEGLPQLCESGDIEDEKHFLVECEYFKEVREEWWMRARTLLEELSERAQVRAEHWLSTQPFMELVLCLGTIDHQPPSDLYPVRSHLEELCNWYVTTLARERMKHWTVEDQMQ